MSNIENTTQSFYHNRSKILFICPKCKKSDTLSFPKSVVENAKNLTTISIPKGLICPHSFQAFVDKNFKVRGYQLVDFEFENNKKKDAETQKDKSLFEDLILNKNEVTFYPEYLKKEKKNSSLKQIYEDFWEYIHDDNPLFKEFIRSDKRRIHFIK
jgi:hypothetical protein